MTIEVGTKVICNGYEGTVLQVHAGQLLGMANVRLARGTVCVDITELQESSTHAHSWSLEADDTRYCGCGARSSL